MVCNAAVNPEILTETFVMLFPVMEIGLQWLIVHSWLKFIFKSNCSGEIVCIYCSLRVASVGEMFVAGCVRLVGASPNVENDISAP